MKGSDRDPTRAVPKVTRAAGSAGSPMEALAALNNVIEAGGEYFKLREQHRTTRAQIDAYRSLETERVRTAERVLTLYFDEVFKERSGNFRELWARLDAAAEAGKDDTVRDVLGAIISLAQTSPLSGLADLGAVRAALDDPNMVWEL
jgi:Ser-tRNA(Ala) deacylase AlaX